MKKTTRKKRIVLLALLIVTAMVSAGQPDAGKLTGGLFTLNGGFWRSPVPSQPATAQDWAHYR